MAPSAAACVTLYFRCRSPAKGRSEVRLIAETAGLRDEASPGGASVRAASRSTSRARAGCARLCGDVLLAEAMPGTPDGQVRVYPSTLSSLVASVEGLLRHRWAASSRPPASTTQQ